MSERTKYYPISLKNKKLHHDFVVEQKIKGFRNADEMVQYLLILNSLTKDEIQALISHTKDIDLCDTEDDDYSGLIKSANMKLRTMLKEMNNKC